VPPVKPTTGGTSTSLSPRTTTSPRLSLSPYQSDGRLARKSAFSTVVSRVSCVSCRCF
jgi:hypothetical protein